MFGKASETLVISVVHRFTHRGLFIEVFRSLLQALYCTTLITTVRVKFKYNNTDSVPEIPVGAKCCLTVLLQVCQTNSAGNITTWQPGRWRKLNGLCFYIFMSSNCEKSCFRDAKRERKEWIPKLLNRGAVFRRSDRQRIISSLRR